MSNNKDHLVAQLTTLAQDIAGQIVLITGGGSGIGRLMCLKSVTKIERQRQRQRQTQRPEHLVDTIW